MNLYEILIVVLFIFFVLASGIIVFILMRLKELDMGIGTLYNKIKKFPTPKELAKQLLNVKLPINEVPEDLMNQIRNFDAANMPPTTETLTKGKKQKSVESPAKYIG